MFERRFDPDEYEQYDCKFTVQARPPSVGGFLGSKGFKGDLKAIIVRRFDPDEYEQYDCKFTVQARTPSGGGF